MNEQTPSWDATEHCAHPDLTNSQTLELIRAATIAKELYLPDGFTTLEQHLHEVLSLPLKVAVFSAWAPSLEKSGKYSETVDVGIKRSLRRRKGLSYDFVRLRMQAWGRIFEMIESGKLDIFTPSCKCGPVCSCPCMCGTKNIDKKTGKPAKHVTGKGCTCPKSLQRLLFNIACAATDHELYEDGKYRIAESVDRLDWEPAIPKRPSQVEDNGMIEPPVFMGTVDAEEPHDSQTNNEDPADFLDDDDSTDPLQGAESLETLTTEDVYNPPAQIKKVRLVELWVELSIQASGSSTENALKNSAGHFGWTASGSLVRKATGTKPLSAKSVGSAIRRLLKQDKSIKLVQGTLLSKYIENRCLKVPLLRP